MTTDLTKGSPLKQILRFSIPFLIGNLFQQFYNIVDMVIVGRTINVYAYTAVGATSSLVWFASGAVQALTIGFSSITARYVGAGDEDGIKRSFATGLKLSGIISSVLALVCALFARQILELLQTPADLIDQSYRYIVWIFIGLVATALFNILSNMIRALGDSKTPLYFLILACVINIILDIVLIAGFGMDTDGAGLATVLAQLLSGLMCIVYIKCKQPLLHVSGKHFRTDKALAVQMLKVGVPMAFLNMVLSVGGIIMQFVTNGLGTTFVASYTTGNKVEAFATQPILSIGSAASVFVAQNYGAKKYGRVLDGIRKSVLLGILWCVIAALLLLSCGRLIVELLAVDVTEEIINNAYLYIIINTLCIFILVPLVIYKGALQALGRTTWSMISGFTEIIGRAGLSMLVITMMSERFALIGEQTGYVIMCFATPSAWLIGALTVLVDYVRLVKDFKLLAAEHEQRE